MRGAMESGHRALGARVWPSRSVLVWETARPPGGGPSPVAERYPPPTGSPPLPPTPLFYDTLRSAGRCQGRRGQEPIWVHFSLRTSLLKTSRLIRIRRTSQLKT